MDIGIGGFANRGRRRRCLTLLPFLLAAFLLVPAANALALGQITVQKAGPGATESVVTSEPAGIDCGSECVHEFGPGAAVTLTAQPQAGHIFDGWEGVTCAAGPAASPCAFKTSPFGFAATVTAKFAPTPEPPGASTQSASAVNFYSARLEGAVDPGGFRVEECLFEWGTTTAYGAKAPCEPSAADLGEGAASVPVGATLGLLQAATTYHYRLLAANPGGPSLGQDLTFTTPAAPPDLCPNAARRAEQGLAGRLLPECRAYELVSEGDNQGVDVTNLLGLSPSGSHALFSSTVFGEPANLASLNDPRAAIRGSAGWAVSSMPPDTEVFAGNNSSNYWPSAGLDSVLWSKATPGQLERGEVQMELSRLDGGVEAASPLIRPILGNFAGVPLVALGSSLELSHVITNKGIGAQTAYTLLPGEELTANGGYQNLYEVDRLVGQSPKLSLVNHDAAGEQIGGVCGAYLGSNMGLANSVIATHAVSNDGSVIYFSARPGEARTGPCTEGSPVRIFKREGTDTVEVSRSECSRISPPCTGSGDDIYQGASADGSIVFFTSPRQLTDSDEDETNDLYVYDSSPPPGQPHLVLASAGETVSGHVSGSGAEVLGVLDNSADGSRVYFVAEGILTSPNSEGDAPASGEDNLYLYERDAGHPSGRITFIAPISGADSNLWSAAPANNKKAAFALPLLASPDDAASVGDGRYLLFLSSARLLPEDTDSVADLYRYDSLGGRLTCLSCRGEGAVPVAIRERKVGESSADYAEESQVASNDGSTVVFFTRERLLPGLDINEAWDLYEWHKGALALLSPGTGESGVVPGEGGISEDGSDAYFETEASLLPADADGGRNDVYAVHLGGGFSQPSPPAACADTEACLGSVAPPPDGGGALPTTTAGPGNQAVPKPAKPRRSKCRKGKVRRHGKCVGKRRHHHRRLHHRTQRNHSKQGRAGK